MEVLSRSRYQRGTRWHLFSFYLLTDRDSTIPMTSIMRTGISISSAAAAGTNMPSHSPILKNWWRLLRLDKILLMPIQLHQISPQPSVAFTPCVFPFHVHYHKLTGPNLTEIPFQAYISHSSDVHTCPSKTTVRRPIQSSVP